jgi:hypothetical protein
VGCENTADGVLGDGAESDSGVAATGVAVVVVVVDVGDHMEGGDVGGDDKGESGEVGRVVGVVLVGRTIFGLLPDRNVCFSLLPKDRLNKLSIFYL